MEEALGTVSMATGTMATGTMATTCTPVVSMAIITVATARPIQEIMDTRAPMDITAGPPIITETMVRASVSTAIKDIRPTFAPALFILAL